MKDEYNFTFEESIVYQETGMLPTRIIPILAKKLADKVDEKIIEKLK